MDDLDTENQPTERSRRGRPARVAEERTLRWVPPQLLPDPTPEPGWAFRWIRVSTMGQDDSMNVSQQLRQGYEPVKATDHPEVHISAAPDGRFKDCIVVGGLMLCKIPQEIADQRDAHYRQQAQAQMTSVDNNFMRQQDPRMPLFNERKSEHSFGKGKA